VAIDIEVGIERHLSEATLLYVNRAEGIAVGDVDGVWSSTDDGAVSEVRCMDGAAFSSFPGVVVWEA